MTVYLINREIIFNPDRCTLSRADSQHDDVILSTNAARCLMLLLDAGGEAVAKDELLHAGWGSRGLVVTGHSITKAIMQLRSALKSLGLRNETILTLPRIGYRFSGYYTVSRMDSPVVPAPASSMNTEPALITKTAAGKTRSQIRRLKGITLTQQHWRYLMPVALICLVVSLWQIYQVSPQAKNINYKAVEHTDGISIFAAETLEDKSYVKASISLLKNDVLLKARLVGEGKPFEYIYINGAVNKNVHSYFLCADEITKHPGLCQAYHLITEG